MCIRAQGSGGSTQRKSASHNGRASAHGADCAKDGSRRARAEDRTTPVLTSTGRNAKMASCEHPFITPLARSRNCKRAARPVRRSQRNNLTSASLFTRRFHFTASLWLCRRNPEIGNCRSLNFITYQDDPAISKSDAGSLPPKSPATREFTSVLSCTCGFAPPAGSTASGGDNIPTLSTVSDARSSATSKDQSCFRRPVRPCFRPCRPAPRENPYAAHPAQGENPCGLDFGNLPQVLTSNAFSTPIPAQKGRFLRVRYAQGHFLPPPRPRSAPRGRS